MNFRGAEFYNGKSRFGFPPPPTMYLLATCLCPTLLTCEGNPPATAYACWWRENRDRYSIICFPASWRKKLTSATQPAGRMGVNFRFIPLCAHISRRVTSQQYHLYFRTYYGVLVSITSCGYTAPRRSLVHLGSCSQMNIKCIPAQRSLK